MKNLNQNGSLNNTQAAQSVEPAKLKIGLDVHLSSIVAVIQEGNQTPKAPRKFTRPEFVAWVKEKIQAGHHAWCVQESCGFGFVFHRELEKAGVHSMENRQMHFK